MKPTKEQIEVGNKIAKDLHEVSTKKALNPDEINIEDIDVSWRDLVVDYMNNEIDSVEAIWTAMNRVEQINYLDGLIKSIEDIIDEREVPSIRETAFIEGLYKCLGIAKQVKEDGYI